jgi:hypothetical protein
MKTRVQTGKKRSTDSDGNSEEGEKIFYKESLSIEFQGHLAAMPHHSSMHISAISQLRRVTKYPRDSGSPSTLYEISIVLGSSHRLIPT